MQCKKNIIIWFTLVYAEVVSTTSVADSRDFKCPDLFFLCKNTTSLCIPRKSVCNGPLDCPDGTDEEGCDDTHASNLFDKLFRKRPSAENDHLDQTCQLNYKGLCICRHRDIRCLHMNLTKIPDNLPKGEIYLLDMSGNSFSVVTKNTLSNIPKNIKKIALTHCNIRNVNTNSFYNLPVVEQLYIDNNKIAYLPAELFPVTNSLTHLIVSYNDIEVISDQALDNLHQLHTLDLSYNKLADLNGNEFQSLANLSELFLRGNRLKHIKASYFPNLTIDVLSLIDNCIETIDTGSFGTLYNLRYLYLANNKLKYLSNGTFTNLTNLLYLTLNDNLLQVLEVGVFLDIPNLQSLDLKKNSFKMLNRDVLEPLDKLHHVYFQRFEMCIAAPRVKVCHPPGDGISSDKHLLHNPLLRASVWVMASVGCVGNLVVLLGRLLAPTNNVVHSLYIKNLALSDLLMGIYLFTIASADQQYRGVYLQHEYTWRHSKMCNACGFLSTLSCESSVLILSLVTWDRFISVTKPLARKQPSAKTAAAQLLCLWLIAIAVAFIPLLDVSEGYFKEFYNNNGVCLPLHIHDPYQEGWEYSIAMFVVVNTMALVFICYAYSRMIHEIRASGVACRSTQQSKDRDKVAQRFGIIVLTDCLCWVPVIIVKITALLGFQISEYLYAWLAIFILPINSALNPVLYTLTTTVFKKQMKKTLNLCPHRKRRQEHQNSGYDSAFSLSFGMFPLGGSTRRGLNHRGTQSSLMTSKDSSWKRPTAV